MSVPSTFEYAQISVNTATSGAANWVVLCGIQSTGFNRTKQTANRTKRDCTSPALIPEQSIKIQSRSRTLTGSGLYNTAQTATINQLADGKTFPVRYTIIDVSNPDVPAGTPLGTWEGPGIFTDVNMATPEDGEGTIELTLQSNGAWTYTAAS